jgi:hypothetical protein
MQKYLDLFSWWFLALFAIPTLLIMGSWNSLPGEFMYPVKIGLEKTLLFFAKPSYSAEAGLNVKYTERRFSEAKVLLANKQSGDGLSYLSQQVEATQAVINRAPNAETKKKLAKQYIATLRTVSAQLSEERTQISQQNSLRTGVAVRPRPTGRSSYYKPIPTQPPVQNTNTGGNTVPNPTEAPPEAPPPTNDVTGQIDDAQNQINNAIDTLNQLSDTPTETPTEPTPEPTTAPTAAPTAEPTQAPSMMQEIQANPTIQAINDRVNNNNGNGNGDNHDNGGDNNLNNH